MKLSANVSEASSGIGDIETTDSAWSTDTLHVEQISQELSNRGSRQSEMELRFVIYLLDGIYKKTLLSIQLISNINTNMISFSVIFFILDYF